MPKSLENFPLALISDGTISYLQWLFGNPEHVPSEYRWNSDDRQSRITIGGPFMINNEVPDRAAYITVERGPFVVDNRVIDNLVNAQENVFDNEESVMVANGPLVITVGSGSASEASSLANFILVKMQSDRHGIIKNLTFLRNINGLEVSPETPVFNAAEIRRWTVTITFSTSLQMGWFEESPDDDILNKFSIRAVKSEEGQESTTGITVIGSDVLADGAISYGLTTDSDVQLLENELNNGWYNVVIDNRAYDVASITDGGALVLTDFISEVSTMTAEYKLHWNDIHLKVVI